MHFPFYKAARGKSAPQATIGESNVMLRELIRIYGEKLSNVTTHIKAAVFFREDLPGVSALFTSLSRAEAGALHSLGTLLQNIQIPTLPQNGILPPERESMADSACAHLQLLSGAYRTQAEHYRRVARLARTDKTKEVLSHLETEAIAHAEVLLSMHARLCRS